MDTLSWSALAVFCGLLLFRLIRAPYLLYLEDEARHAAELKAKDLEIERLRAQLEVLQRNIRPVIVGINDYLNVDAIHTNPEH